MAAVVLRNIRKAFGAVEVIHGIDLHIRDDEFVVFVGPSGCGKSTLLRLIAGLEDVTGGEIAIDGQPVNDLPPARRGIAMVFQSYALYPHMTVYDNMAFGLKLAKYGRAGIDGRVRHAARILQIEHLLERRPRELSGGQRQRVAIGRAIVREPKVFLFDEPLSNLDAALRVQMRIEIASLKRQLGATMIYVTHDQVEAMTLADRIVVLNAGRVEQVGTPLELYHHPRNLFVAGFIGSPRMNFIETTVRAVGRDTVTIDLPGGGSLTVPARGEDVRPGRKLTLGIRPEHLGEPVPSGPALSGVVVVAERLGEATYVYLRIADGSMVVVRAGGNAPVQSGDMIAAGLLANHSHLFGEDGMALDRPERHPLADIATARRTIG